MLFECDQPFDHIPIASDCDDGNDEINPDADEVCNALDDDCNGLVDDNATDFLPFYADADADGYGDPLSIIDACQPPVGYTDDDTDCDDTEDTIFPGAQEYCDGIDQNCDGNNFYELDLDGNNLLVCEESIGSEQCV